ncbi:MAG: glycoside hydrolase, partial [Bacteroidales bacterium]|nr:glycoside hydrolase [Bacteroidales bacterium]
MKIKNILFTILIILPLLTCGQQNPESHTGIEVFNNFRIYPSEVTQTEVFIVRSPMNPELLFSSCNTLNFIPFFVSEGIYVSGDGGNSWQGNDTCIGDPISFHGGDPGIAIDKNGSFILTRLGRAPFTGLYSHYSDDKGQSWSNQQVISTDDLERASVSTDAVPASSYYGRTYASWVKFAQPYPVMFSYTDDGAESWSDPVPVNDPPNRSAGGDVTVGPDGEVYVCWAGVTSTSPFKEIYAGFATSADGGQNWQVLENAFPMNGITGILPEKGNIRVNGLPLIAVDSTNATRKGWIY